MKTRDQDDGASIREQAAKWLTELPGASVETHTRFVGWLKTSPRHVEEFLVFQALWSELDGLDPQHQLDLQPLIASARTHHAGAQIVPFRRIAQQLRAAVPSRLEHAGLRSYLAVAAALACLSIAFVWPGLRLLSPRDDIYTTSIGEQRAIKLDDGSFVYLNTGSRVQIHYSNRTRELRLLDGEALFSVAPVKDRPFRVYAGDTVIEALGTQFDVYRRAENTTVAVIEGRVGVAGRHSTAPTEASAGEQAAISSTGAITKHQLADVADATAWRARRLVFTSNTLADVAAEFNRYNRLKIEIESDAVRSRRIIGTFSADDPQSLVQFRSGEEDLTVERTARAIIIRQR